MDLTFEELNRALRYDPGTGELFWRNTGLVACRPAGKYRKIEYKGQGIQAHRVAWLLHFGEWPACRLKHRDEDGGNNRIENLRLSYQLESKPLPHRLPKGKNYMGVLLARPGVYVARINVRRRDILVGTYRTEEEAARAYDRAAVRFYGKMASANFPRWEYE